MPAVAQFFEEINPVFGFFFDIGLACTTARERVTMIQREIGADDDSPFMVRSGPPIGSVEEELERSLHRTTIGEVKRRLEDNGFDLMKAAEATVIFTFHIWDEKYRQLVATERQIPVNELRINSLGDLRLIRHSIIHNKGIAASDIARCRVFTRFKPGERISLNKQDIYDIILALRADLAPYA